MNEPSSPSDVKPVVPSESPAPAAAPAPAAEPKKPETSAA